jgi:hypothetical protein
MAKMKRPIGDLVSGKIGNVVFVTMGGKSYVRAAPQRKKDSWSADQLLYRQRISRVSALWRALKSDQMSRIWNSAAQEMNGYAWFLKLNMPALEMDGTLIDPKLLKVSDGKLPVPQNLKAERQAENPSVVRVSWQNDPHTSGKRLQDELMAVSYVDGRFSKVMATGLLRSALSGSFALPQAPGPVPQAPSHLFLFMGSSDEYSGSRAF